MATRLDMNRRHALWVAGSLAVVALGYSLYPRPVERLKVVLPTTGPQPVAIWDESLICAADSLSLALHKMPLRGGKSVPLFPAEAAPLRLTAVKVIEGAALMRYEEFNQTSGALETRRRVDSRPAGLYRMAFDGSPPKLIKLSPKYRWSVLGETCYGVTMAPPGPPGRMSGPTSRPFPVEKPVQPPPDGDLVAASIADGSVRKIAVVPSGTYALGIGDGVAWTVREPEATEAMLCATFPPDYRIVVVADSVRSIDDLMLHDEKLYWIVRQPPDSAWKLMCAPLDGAGAREVMSGTLPALTHLEAYRGRLYGVFYRGERKAEISVLNGAGEFSKPVPLTGFQGDRPLFAGEYAYFPNVEPLEDWFDWSSPGLLYKTQTTLCRVRLPR